MRSYKQRCGLAKALEVVGDRWTLLIVRELLIRGSCRYTDVRRGLPGIATNLLAERFRELEYAGIVIREEAPPPIAATLFQLTERGRELEDALLQLGRWGAPLLAHRAKGETLQPHWLVLPLKLVLVDGRPEDPAVNIEWRAGGELMTITASNGTIDVRLGAAEGPAAAVVTGKPETILQLFAGRIDLPTALAAGVRWEGAPEILRRVVPTASVNHAGRGDPERNLPGPL
jgi:DNA-binding HxlR family transcriptional regulator